MLDKIERLRKLQKESNIIIDDIYGSLENKCREGLLEVLETVLENAHEFPDSESALRVVDELAGSRSSSHKKDRSKKEKGSSRKNIEESV